MIARYACVCIGYGSEIAPMRGVVIMDISTVLPSYIVTVMVLALGSMLFFFRRKERRHPVEQGKTPLYSETCGGMIGMFRYTVPFLRLSVYEDQIVIGAFKPIALALGDIAKIEIGRFLLSTGIRIHHRRTDVPAKIVIWTGAAEKVRSLLAGKVAFE